MPSLPAALELRAQLLTNAYGPALITSALYSAGLLVAPPGAPPATPNFPTTDLKHRPRDAPYPLHEGFPLPTCAPHYERAGLDGPNVPIVVNVWSTMGSVKWGTEIWEGGSLRDDLVFHPTYAASKAALSGVMVHLAREMRVSAAAADVSRSLSNAEDRMRRSSTVSIRQSLLCGWEIAILADHQGLGSH